MMGGRGRVLVQVAGRGKDTGKTSLICQLLRLFPGSWAVKSGIHFHPSEGAKPVDTDLYLSAGADEAAFFHSDDTAGLIRFITSCSPRSGIVFLERNRRVASLPPDLYIFLRRPSKLVRSDAAELEKTADVIIEEICVSPDLEAAIRDHQSAARRSGSAADG